ncbi:MAG: ABC transporter permease [Oscillospiraceae bacterium]|nr:ABC transporter permease [Oscillospiraceae bacterium]
MTELTKENFSLLNSFRKIPFSTRAVGGLYLAVLILGIVNGFNISTLLSASLHLFGVWAVLALANVPSIQAGTGPNFALPIGIVSGLLAMVLVLSLDIKGMAFILLAALLAIVFGSLAGYLYGRLMNAVKGSEMAIAPYTGFAITAVFGLLWLAIPIGHPHMIFFLGGGLRHQIPLDQFDANFILARFLEIEIFGLEIRTGELLVVFAGCFLMWLFFRTKTGIAMSAVGRNPMFAKASGINVDRSRVIANMMSTAIAALGVIVYAQGFGFVQLYDFPMFMAFPAIACILVGGASGQRAKVANVIVGTFLFQGLMATALPVFTRVLEGAGFVNALRMIIQNGIILYALSRMSKGGN